ncbi:unnamed protein product [Paramecium primaurelia]|uniref:EGF-like domain-containing protein n=1 Tax=Paramecium primaurelia TaxID=5886 RepID=A0A8S1NZY8_PARPR|nr:unnamed protein product [Paramecium primaurelia]
MDSSYVCQSCVSPCLNCNSSIVCTSCVDNYYISGNTCIQCTLPCYNCVDLAAKCTSCANANQSVFNDTCICDDGFYMDGSLQCQPCIHPCTKCETNGNHCTECASTYVMSTTILNTCECPAGKYEVLAHSPTDCQPCTQPCDTCTGSPDHCLTCIDINQTVNASYLCECNIGYLMSGVNCVQCVNPCLQCSGSTNYCTQCKDIQHYVSTGSCICNPGWVNDNNYDCIACQSPCVTCSVNDTHCESCIDINNVINASYQCICKDTYYSDTVNTCAPCISPCVNCDINGCLTCIDSNQIIDSSYNCICKPGYYSVGYNCSQCTLPCQTCEINQDHCLTCIDVNQTQINNLCICNDGYFAVSNYCQQCQLPCTKCEISNDHCLECLDPNHDLINNQCICKFGYGSSGNGGINCSFCQYPCLDCSTSVSTCLSCIDSSLFQLQDNKCLCQEGYFQIDTQCKRCLPQCSSCIDESDICLKCSDLNHDFIQNSCICKYGYYTNIEMKCSKCQPPCLTCELNYDYQCASTYVMSTTILNTCECPAGKYEVLAHSPTDCQPCTQPCDTCTGSPDHCLTCIDINQTVNASYLCECNIGYLMSGVNCVQCVNPCLQCSGSTNYCTQCKDIQHYVSTGSCICNPGWVNDNNYDCIACQSPCVTCSVNDTHCESCIDINNVINASYQCICKDTYYSDTVNTCAPCISPCVNCDINGCLTCIDSNQIIDSSYNCICKPGYYSVGYNCSQCTLPCQTCEINQDHCLTCIDVNQTQINNLCICNDGYFAVSNYCQQCQLPCTKCEISNDHCLECLDPNHDLINNQCICKFGYGSSGNGGINCSFCQYPCLDCSTSVSTCLSCIDSSLFQLQDNKCLCQEGYFQIDTQCKRCLPQCSSCIDESDICLKCSDLNHDFIQNSCICKYGYYTNIEMKCSKCQPPCLTCELNYDYCTSCHDDKQLVVNGQCQCDDGYYLSNLKCAQCNKVCTKCNSYSECTECIDEYYLHETSCLKCQIPCSTCLDISTCITCADNYFMNYLSECIQCILNCKTCIDTSSCITCYDQFYYDNSSFSCIPCFNNCKSCENTSYFCTSCVDINHQLIDNNCICRDGYYEENYICKPCDPTCKNCYSLTFCTECYSWNKIILLNNLCVCEDGYYLTHNKCDICDKSCLTCSQLSNNCLSCNQQLNKILQKNTCVCQKGYFENDQNECWSCNSNEGKIIKDCKYKDCSDFIWTYGEDCDDGNNVSRDGCSNCKIDNNYSCLNTLLNPSLCFQCSENCLECQLNENLKQSECIKCKDGFFLLQSKCARCTEKCLTCDINASNCKSCRYLKNDLGECQLCESKNGYYSDQINNKCYSKCGDSLKAIDEECDDGNLLAGDGCDQNCKKEKKFICKDGICITPEYPTPKLISFGDTSLYHNIRQFKLEYNLLLNITQNDQIENEFELYIKNQLIEKPIDCQYKKQSSFTFNNQSKMNFSVIFELQFNRSSKQEELIIKYLNISKFISYQGYSQQEPEVSTAISDYMFIDQSSVAQVQMATNSNQYVLYVMAVMGGGAILFGGLDIFYNLLDTIQMLSYLKYVNTQMPYNLQEFFDFFGFAQLNFISKYFNLQGMIEPFISYQDLKPVPPKIEKDDINSLFIINGSSILVVWLSFLGVYILSTYVPQILSKFKFKYYNEIPGVKDVTIKFKLMFLAAKIFITQLCYIIVSEFFYSGIFRTLLATAYDYSFSMTLQLYALELHSKDILVRLSSYLALIAFGIYLLAIYVVTKISGGSQLSQKQLQNKQKYGSLIEGIKKDNYSKYFNAIILVKKLLFMKILIFCFSSPFLQSINLTLLSSLQTLYLIFCKPLEDDKEFKKQLSCEINTTSSLVLISSLVLDEELKIFSDDLRLNIGWFCIANISLIFVIQLIIDAIQQWTLLIKKYKQLKMLVEKINQLFHSHTPQQPSHEIFIRTDNQNN